MCTIYCIARIPVYEMRTFIQNDKKRSKNGWLFWQTSQTAIEQGGSDRFSTPILRDFEQLDRACRTGYSY